MERRLAAILAADVVGYTHLMGEDEAGTLRRMTALREEILELIRPGFTGGSKVRKTWSHGKRQESEQIFT